MNVRVFPAATMGLVLLAGGIGGMTSHACGQIVPIAVEGSVSARTGQVIAPLPPATTDSFTTLDDEAIGTSATIFRNYGGVASARTQITQPTPHQIRFTGRSDASHIGTDWAGFGENAETSCSARVVVSVPSTLALAGTIFEFVPSGIPGPYFATTSVRVFVNDTLVHSRVMDGLNIFSPPTLPWTSATLLPGDQVRIEAGTTAYSGRALVPPYGGASPYPAETWFDFTVTATGVTPACDSIDFNGNGVFPEDQDVVDFLNVLAGAPCPSPVPCDIDFNNNGVFPEDQDVVDFFNVLAGAAC
ncbi:hypothetical protein LBMAG48_13610 [Phycisphaerae bacterium]|nr:hypothetical protein LBMAG48_13610 [Phycisphaerae bacterium]